jgi:anti-anti-sigma factor
MSASTAPTEQTELHQVLDGDVTATTAPALRKRLKDAIGGGSRQIVLDLRKCTMVDSSGIGLFVATHNSLVKIGGSLKLVGVNSDLRELFQAMRLQQHFDIQG